jgi:hypothetical protein
MGNAWTMLADLAPLAGRLRRTLGEDAVVTDEAQLRTYECDGLTHYRVTPSSRRQRVDRSDVDPPAGRLRPDRCRW